MLNTEDLKTAWVCPLLIGSRQGVPLLKDSHYRGGCIRKYLDLTMCIEQCDGHMMVEYNKKKQLVVYPCICTDVDINLPKDEIWIFSK